MFLQYLQVFYYLEAHQSEVKIPAFFLKISCIRSLRLSRAFRGQKYFCYLEDKG